MRGGDLRHREHWQPSRVEMSLGMWQEEGVPGASTHLPMATAHKIVSRATCPVLTIRH